MKIFMTVGFVLLMSTPLYAETPGVSCVMAEKELTLIKSQLDVIEEKYKVFVKQSIAPQVQGKSGQPVNIKIDSNNDFVKSIAKLAVAQTTFEALLEMCKDGSLKTTTTQTVESGTDNYNAKLIPKP